jgi:hypothetical protein
MAFDRYLTLVAWAEFRLNLRSHEPSSINPAILVRFQHIHAVKEATSGLNPKVGFAAAC